MKTLIQLMNKAINAESCLDGKSLILSWCTKSLNSAIWLAVSCILVCNRNVVGRPI